MGDRTWLYVIELEPREDPLAKWYVGITDDPNYRYWSHCNTYGSYWTHRNECVDMHVLGPLESKYHAREVENQLTLALWDEYGPNTTQGGKYVGRGATEDPVPDERDIHLNPAVDKWLSESENDELSRLSNRTPVCMEINGEIPFESLAAAEEWADKELPEGTWIKITGPGNEHETFQTEKADGE